jgi:YgiT-type zinc finger domain-containing protein
MYCEFCHTDCERKYGKTTQGFSRGDTMVVIKDIPANECGNCEEPYLSPEVRSRIEEIVVDAVQRRVEVEILRYAA